MYVCIYWAYILTRRDYDSACLYGVYCTLITAAALWSKRYVLNILYYSVHLEQREGILCCFECVS